MTDKSPGSFLQLVNDAYSQKLSTSKNSPTHSIMMLDYYKSILKVIQDQSMQSLTQLEGINDDQARSLREIIATARRISHELELGIASLSGMLRSNGM